MARVVEASAVICDGEFLDLLDRASVIDGDGGVVAESVQEEHFLLAEALHGAVNKLNHSKNAVLGLKRDADNRASLPLGHLVNAFGEARVVVDVGHDERIAVLGDPPGNAFSNFEANSFQGF